VLFVRALQFNIAKHNPTGVNVAEEVVILGDLIISSLLKARDTLGVALAAPKTDLNRDASIQRFAFTFELAWKTMKRILKYKSIFINNPRDTIRESAKEGLINDPKAWLLFLESRNLTSLVYNEDIAEKIYSILSDFKASLDVFISNIQRL
jgi:nucleotidyltransferase substrate binding protein (TIGR01987 family)